MHNFNSYIVDLKRIQLDRTKTLGHVQSTKLSTSSVTHARTKVENVKNTPKPSQKPHKNVFLRHLFLLWLMHGRTAKAKNIMALWLPSGGPWKYLKCIFSYSFPWIDLKLYRYKSTLVCILGSPFWIWDS